MTRLKDVAVLDRSSLPEHTDPDRRFRYIDIGSVDSSGNVGQLTEMRFADAPSRARKLVRPGDSIVSTVRTYLRAIAHIGQDADDLVVSTGFATLTPKDGVVPGYLKWVVRSNEFIEAVVARSVGVSYPAITTRELGTIHVPLYPVEEQQRIVDYLDTETARIDDLVTEQRKLLQLLDEHFRASLLAAVLCGIDGEETVERSELGGMHAVASWDVRPLRALPVEIQTGPFGSQLHQSDYVEGGFPVVNPANLVGGRLKAIETMTVSEETRAALSRHILRPGDVVFGRRGEMGRAGLVTSVEDGWLCGTGSLRIRFTSPVFDPGYLKRFLETSLVKQHLEAASVGATMDNLNSGIVGRIPMLLPPLADQQRVASQIALDEKRQGALREEIHLNLGFLQEHRQALITAAVTGGLDTVGRVA